MVEAPHGRAPAVATGVKRTRPDCIVFTYQGDGDLAAIGTAEIVHAGAREYHNNLYKQRRHGDRRQMAPHHPAGTDYHHITIREKCELRAILYGFVAAFDA